ncbi:MAG: biotin/lipoyl-binding protein [Bacilli bacterium]|jgi:biotin carboxyl carrier protein|nr:biotin/lipoyl-binding protein [Bacilli bacterium]
MRIYNIQVNGKKYEVKVMGITEVEPVEVKTVKGEVPAKAEAPKAAPAAAPAASGKGEPVLAPMQGNILNVMVKVGDSVKAGQTIIILEAMKLENEIKAPRDGVVSSIAVSKGQAVNNKAVLLTLE